VNLFDLCRACQLKKLEAPLEVISFPVTEPLASIIGLRQFQALDHGAHGAVEEDDAFLEEAFERMDIHDEGGIKGIFGPLQAIY
jgi:hypothetical protein